MPDSAHRNEKGEVCLSEIIFALYIEETDSLAATHALACVCIAAVCIKPLDLKVIPKYV